MRLDLAGHPLHTRALSIVVDVAPDGALRACGELVDVRKRGFTPVGTEMQGAGIIHQMGLEARVDPGRRVLEAVTAWAIVSQFGFATVQTFEPVPGTPHVVALAIAGANAAVAAIPTSAIHTRPVIDSAPSRAAKVITTANGTTPRTVAVIRRYASILWRHEILALCRSRADIDR